MLKKLGNWYWHRTRWFSLSAVGETAWVKASVVMPIFGYLIVLNAELLQYAEIDSRFRILASENPWRLLCIYFGSMFVGIGSGIYQACRPDTTKYGSAAGFYNVMRDFAQSPSVGIRFAEIVLNSKSSEGMAGLRSRDRVDEISKAIISVSLVSYADVSALCGFIAQNDDRSKRWAARSCRAMFDVGFVLLTIPAFLTFLGVLSFVVRLLANSR